MLVWRNNAVQTVCEKTFHILPRIACLSAMGHITGGWRRRWRWRCTVHRERGTSQGFTTTSSLSPPVCWNLPCCAMGGENLHSCTCACTRLLCICNYACTLEVQVEPTTCLLEDMLCNGWQGFAAMQQCCAFAMGGDADLQQWGCNRHPLSSSVIPPYQMGGRASQYTSQYHTR